MVVKFITGISIAFVLISFVSSESCTTNTDCVATVCVEGTHVICEHEDGDGVVAGGGLCTCAADICLSREECLAPAHPELDCRDDRRHCYDGRCICSRFQIGGGGDGGVGK